MDVNGTINRNKIQTILNFNNKIIQNLYTNLHKNITLNTRSKTQPTPNLLGGELYEEINKDLVKLDSLNSNMKTILENLNEEIKLANEDGDMPKKIQEIGEVSIHLVKYLGELMNRYKNNEQFQLMQTQIENIMNILNEYLDKK